MTLRRSTATFLLLPLLLVLFSTSRHSALRAAPLPPTVATEPLGSVRLRDITVTPGDGSATITFLLSGAAKTVVVERKESNLAQVRMKSLSATDAALRSALLKPGVVSIGAHVERTDVLITDVRFARQVTEVIVLRRDSTKVVVHVTLGKSLMKDSAARGASASKGSLSVIVIDAGHGGEDPGTIGLGDVTEKTITLSVAKKLKAELARTMPHVTVVLTRTDDRYIELKQRADIANGKNGQLFLSIHCNAAPEKPHDANGFECWIFRPPANDSTAVGTRGKDAGRNGGAAHDTAAKRPVGTRVTRPTPQQRRSYDLASIIREEMADDTPLRDRGIHQAEFFVLVRTAMPAVLIELGYLTNEKDQKTLTSESGQKKIVAAIAAGIKEYEKKKYRGAK